MSIEYGKGCSGSEFLSLIRYGEVLPLLPDFEISPPKYSMTIKITAGDEGE